MDSDPFFDENFMERILEEFKRFQEQFEKKYAPAQEALKYRWIEEENKKVLVINYLATVDEKIELKIKRGQVEIYGIGKIMNQELTFNTIISIPSGVDSEGAEVKFIKKGLIKIYFPLKENIYRKKKKPEKLTPVPPGKDDITI